MFTTTTSATASSSVATELTVRQVYDRYRINSKLRLHMCRVASLMDRLLKAWRGPAVNEPVLLETMLLHDLGNLVKFDLQSTVPATQSLMTPEELPVYQALQADWHTRYGKQVDEVTCRLIQELSLQHGAAISRLISRHNPTTLAETAVDPNDWEQKLCDYTDFRIGPFGLLTLEQRFADLAERYRDRQASWQDQAETQRRLHLFQTLESQLQTHLSCDLQQLTEADLGVVERWLDYRFATSGILSTTTPSTAH